MTNQLSAISPSVTIHNGKAVTTSRQVASYFGKQHFHVIEKIKSLDCSAQFLTLNFSRVPFEHNGNQYEEYEMTKDGFVFLVMGFTGKKAAQFKEAYIAEFNRMEVELLSRSQKLNGKIVITIRDGEIYNTETLKEGDYYGPLESFFHIAKRAGYVVIDPDELIKKLNS